jgi:hypothetical protein
VGFHYGPVRQVSAVCENIHIMVEVTENNGRSWVGVFVGVWILVLILLFLVGTFSRCVYVFCVGVGNRGWKKEGRKAKYKLQKTVCFILVESLDVPSEHKIVHLARCCDTPKNWR